MIGRRIRIHGRVNAPNGEPVEQGTYEIVFAYSADTGRPRAICEGVIGVIDIGLKFGEHMTLLPREPMSATRDEVLEQAMLTIVALQQELQRSRG